MSAQSMSGIERPTNVTISAILQFINGIIALLIGLILLDLIEELASNGDEEMGGFLGTFLVIVFILGVGALTVGLGLWTMKKMSYQAAIIFTLIFIFIAILTLPIGFILLIINALMVYYLTRPETKEVFGITGFLS